MKRKVHFLPLPTNSQGGCGEAFVRRHLCDDVVDLRARCGENVVLFVVTDADTLSVDQRLEKLTGDDGTAISSDELLAVWIPKRNIESWIYYFRNGYTDEEKAYSHFSKPSKCQDEARKMSRQLMDNSLNDVGMSSLRFAQSQFNRICTLQKNRA